MLFTAKIEIRECKTKANLFAFLSDILPFGLLQIHQKIIKTEGVGQKDISKY